MMCFHIIRIALLGHITEKYDVVYPHHIDF
jgi:hypothetical protein